MQNTEILRGVFSLQEVRKVGTGTTTRKTISKTYWFVETNEETGQLTVQSLNSKYIPTGNKKPITREEVIEKFSPEMEFYVSTVYPKIKELNTSIDAGDEHRAKNELFSAEFEYESALELDIQNVRANFGIGLTYLEQGKKDKANNIFERLVGLDAAFKDEHKHLFNEFGISLRKNKMYTKAIDFYNRAISLGKADENLHINMARVYLETKKFPEMLVALGKAIAINPKSDMVEKILQWSVAKKLLSEASVSEMRQKVASGEINPNSTNMG